MRTTVFALAALLTGGAVSAAPPVQSRTLPNGLTVLVVEDHAVPLVTVEIAAKNGSMTEDEKFNGVSHLYEHMFFKANKAIPSQEAFLARGRELGLSWNGTTNTERVNYFFTTTASHFDDAMVFLRDAVVSPLFDEKEFERERVVVTGEIDRNESNPGYYLWHETGKRVWWKYPSYKDPLGSRRSVLAATTDMMRTIQQRYYVPNNSVLVVTGDVKAADVFTKAGALYAGWKRAEDPFVKHPLVKHPPIPKTEVVLVEQPVQSVTGMMTWHGPSTVGDGADLTYPADLLGYALQQPSSRFQKDLVDSGACVAVNFNWLTQMNTGPITFTFVAPPDKVDSCVAAVRAELPKMKRADYLSDEELKNAGFALEMDFTKQRETPSGFAHTLTFWWTSAGLDYYNGYVDNVKKATRAGIARFLDTYVLGKPFVCGVMVSPAMAKANGLDRAHFESLLSTPLPAEAAAAAPTPIASEGSVTAWDLDGMEILVKRVPGAELTSAQLYLKGGVRNWSAEDAGVEHLAVAAAASGGTERLPKEAFGRRLESIGSTLEGSSGDDFASFSAKSLTARFPETFDLMAEAFLTPALPPSELEVTRQRMLLRLRFEQDSPDGQLSLLVRRALFAGHPYERRAAGTLESVSKLTREKALAHLARLREKGRLLLVVVGDVDPAAVYAKAQAAFGSLPRGSYKDTPLPKISFDKARLVAETRKLPTQYIQSVFTAPANTDPGYAAARVAMSLLGYREFEEVRTKRNLSYAPGAWLHQGGVSYGALSVTAVDPMTTMKVMFDQARRLQTEPVSAKELAATKEPLLTAYLVAGETTEGQAELLANSRLLAGDFREAGRFVEKVRAVTAEDVQAFARTWIRNLQTVQLGDPATFEKGLTLSP